MTIANILFDTMKAIALSFLTLLCSYVAFRFGRIVYHFIRKTFFLLLVMAVVASCMKYPAQSKVLKQNTHRYNSKVGR